VRTIKCSVVAVAPDLHQPVILRPAQTTTQCTRIHIPSTPNPHFEVGRITNNPLTSSPSPYPLTVPDLDFEQAFCQIPGAGSSHSLSGVHYLRHPRNETLRPGYSFCTRNRTNLSKRHLRKSVRPHEKHPELLSLDRNSVPGCFGDPHLLK
jgi:hypothetical protein